MISLKINYIFIILVDLYASLSRFFLGYPDPDQRLLIRIRIRPNDTDPDPVVLTTYSTGGGNSIKGFPPFGKASRQQLFTAVGVSLNQSGVVKP